MTRFARRGYGLLVYRLGSIKYVMTCARTVCMWPWGGATVTRSYKLGDACT